MGGEAGIGERLTAPATSAETWPVQADLREAASWVARDLSGSVRASYPRTPDVLVRKREVALESQGSLKFPRTRVANDGRPSGLDATARILSEPSHEFLTEAL